ncbi:hypothetical protein ACFLTH_12555 [Bacteroidota bacterium]
MDDPTFKKIIRYIALFIALFAIFYVVLVKIMGGLGGSVLG